MAALEPIGGDGPVIVLDGGLRGETGTNYITSVAGRIGAITLTKTDVGLSSVNNTSDVNKPVSTAQQASINDALAKAKRHAVAMSVALG